LLDHKICDYVFQLLNEKNHSCLSTTSPRNVSPTVEPYFLLVDQKLYLKLLYTVIRDPRLLSMILNSMIFLKFTKIVKSSTIFKTKLLPKNALENFDLKVKRNCTGAVVQLLNIITASIQLLSYLYKIISGPH
jgi:hypothetical protein